MEDLVFIKRKVGRFSDDVSLSVTSDNTRISIYFRNGVDKLITNGKTDYIIVALLKNRIYFKRSDIVEGYKLSESSKSGNNLRIQISGKVAPTLLKFVENNTGEYPLKYDPDRELHYILCE